MTADLALLAADPNNLERYADPGEFIIAACERAKGWLAQALDGSHIEEIMEVKSQAEAIRVYSAQKHLGHDAELAAAEIVRRAERGIGLAIRKGQQSGQIAKQGDIGGTGGLTGDKRDVRRGEHLVTPSGVTGMRNSTLSEAIYQVTDGVTDEQFDSAVATAKAEGDLSRTNVLRKTHSDRGWQHDAGHTSRLLKSQFIKELAAQGLSSRQMASRIGITDVTVRSIAREYAVTIPADQFTHKSRHINSTRVVRETVLALEGAAAGLDLIDYDDIDTTELAHWVTSLTESMRDINRFVKQIKEMTQ